MPRTAPKLEGADLYGFDAMLSEEERAAKKQMRGFVDREVLPTIGKHFDQGTFPSHLMKPLGELGCLGSNLTGYGCPGMSSVMYGLVMQELERGDSGLRSFCSVQGSLAMYPIWQFGTEAQKQKFLPKMAKGELVGCFGLTEPDFGSDPGGMRTRAVKDGDHYVLNGTKLWITNGTFADLAIVWAKVDQGGPESVRGFIVEKGMPGFTAREIGGKMSLRASATAELSFQDVRVPAANLLPGSDGLKSPLMCLNQARYGIAWGAVGAAIACFESARDYTLARTQFGKPIAAFQLTQAKLVEMLTEIVKANLLALALGRAKDAGTSTHLMVSLAKRNNVKIALEIAREARAMHGANGITTEYAPIRHALNLESVYTYEGTHEVHTLILGKALTGIDAFGAA
jgi:glutaryl-CoA dehydrogenase